MGQLADFAAIGEKLALNDPLLTALRDAEAEGPARKGFDIGLAVAGSDTLQGPGKEKFKTDHINEFDPAAYQRAVDYTVDHNANADFAARGSVAVTKRPDAVSARAKLPLSNQWLGFNIAAGIFGSRDDGAQGNTAQGPGSRHIRELLSASSRLGYDAALSFYKIPP